jgi:small subunit ribosomal protein S17e
MGRIKTTLTMRTAIQLVKEHADSFNADFEGNKKVIAKYVNIPSKKLRNVVAGYVTRLVKQSAE